jgi:Flp pilus assembly pilin Flp
VDEDDLTQVRTFRRNESGASALEFALILPIFVTMIIGGMFLADLAFASTSLHYAVQEAARCAGVKTTICSDSATTVAYAQKRYSGPDFGETFSYAKNACGHTVTATGTFVVPTGLTNLNVPLTAAACFPA